MHRSRPGLKVLGLCAVLLGVIAVTAGSARAEATSFWTMVSSGGVLTKITTEALLPEVQIKEIEELKSETDPGKHLVLLTTIGAANTPIAILCSTLELMNVAGTAAPKLLREGGLLGKAKFTGCLTKLNGVTSAPCKAHSKGSPEGTIVTELIKALIKLHVLTVEGKEIKDDTILLFPENAKGEEATTLVTLILGQEGELSECSVSEKLPLEGGLALYDPAGNTSFTEEKTDHLFAEFPGLKLLHFGLRQATINGSLILHLVGAHLNLKWGAMPG